MPGHVTGCIRVVLRVAAMLAFAIGCSNDGGEPVITLKVGVLFDHSGPLGEFGRTGDDGVRLALDHFEAAAGVTVGAITMISADAATDVETAVREARRLVEEEGVHAIIGPLGSSAVLAVARQVTIPAGIPLISPTATTPELTTLDDHGLVFRNTASDAAQAPVLARLAASEGYRHLGVLYRDDAFGKGLSDAFARDFEGKVSLEPVFSVKTSYREQLERMAAEGAEALVAMTHGSETGVYLREALDLGLFDRFLFVDATPSERVVQALGTEAVEGMKGTAPAASAVEFDTDSAGSAGLAFEAAFAERFDRSPTSGLEANAYDIAVCLVLAAVQAKSTDGISIGGALPAVCGGEGTVVGPGSAGVASALATVRSGKAVNYDGASSAMDWDAAGDLAVGAVVIWQFQDGQIVELERVEFGS